MSNTIDSDKVDIKSTSIVFVMDASGSMETMGDEPVQGLNNFYTKQKESGEFTSTLVFFSENVTFHHKNINGKDVPTLTKNDYNIGGMTALYDAIGQSIEYQKSIKTENVIFVILTDGLENSSREYKKTTIKNLITKMEKEHKWLFIYLGANQDSFEVSSGLGIHNSADYEYSPAGCIQVMRSISENVSRCISHDSKPNEINSECLKTTSNKRVLNSP